MKNLWFILFVSFVLVIAQDETEDQDVVVDVQDEAPLDDVQVEKVQLDITYISPEDNVDFFFLDHFDDASTLGSKWTKSQAIKEGNDETIAKYDGKWEIEPLAKDALPGDTGLVLMSKAKHSAVAANMKKPFKFAGDRQLIVQYEIAFQNGQDCGGGYLKLLSELPSLDLKSVTDKTPYTIMFGPDKCGSDSKLHFIFRHVNPRTGEVEEKHCKKMEGKGRQVMEEIFKDKNPHLLRLLVRPDNTFEISIDHTLINHGSLLDSFTPPVNPPDEIEDPNDFKPTDWDEREKIPDPDANKPDDWDEKANKQILDEDAVKPSGWLDDEPDMIPDPEAIRPDDWDDDMDGDWEAPLISNAVCSSTPGCGPWQQPMIDNPAYKGKWFAPMITNQGYQGKWKPAKIPNPDYFNDTDPFKMTPLAGIGIELWSMSDSIYFDNILITDNLSLADNLAKKTYDLKMTVIDSVNGNMFMRLLDYSNKNPWLYAVYVVLVGLPAVLIITFCCSGNKDTSGDKSSLNDPKKTDEKQDDDLAAEQAEITENQNEDGSEGEEEGEGEPLTTKSQTKKRNPIIE